MSEFSFYVREALGEEVGHEEFLPIWGLGVQVGILEKDFGKPLEEN